MLSINYNPSVLKAQNNLALASDAVSSALERMSTGFKINRASDDAAGLYVATKMSSQIRGLLQAKKNVSDGLSLLNTAEGDLGSVQDLLLRIRDLSLQASNGIYDDSARKAMQDEADLLIEEVYRIIDSSNFNGMKIFDSGTATASTFSAFGSYSWKLNAESVSVSDVSAVSPPQTHESVALSGSSGVSTLSSVSRMTEEEALAQGYTVIKTAQDLDNIRNDLDGKYILMNDIDLSSYSNWDPIGEVDLDTGVGIGFTGILDGNGYVVKNLTITSSSKVSVGLFGGIGYFNTDSSASGQLAEVKNLGIEKANITTSAEAAGILAGIKDYSQITNCYTTGKIEGNSSLYVGGLVGASVGEVDNMSNNLIDKCYSSATVIVDSPQGIGGIFGDSAAGGIAGYLVHSIVKNSYFTGNIQAINGYAGGIAGGVYSAEAMNCYATGKVSGLYTGGILGVVAGSIVNSIWNEETTGQTTASSDDSQGQVTNSYGLTTAEMQDPANWAGWDTDIWDFSTYPPKLKWETQSTNPDDPDNPDTPDTPDDPSAVGAIRLQVGANASADANAIIFNTSFDLGDIDVDFSSSQTASNSLNGIDALLDRISKKRSEFGAIMNRLESVLNTQTSQIENLTASKSTIMDADIAQESADYVKNQILQQTTASLLAQAQSANNAVIMALIRG